MWKAVAGFAGDQPNAMLALSVEKRIFSLCAKDAGSILMLENSVFSRILDREKLEDYNEHKS